MEMLEIILNRANHSDSKILIVMLWRCRMVYLMRIWKNHNTFDWISEAN